MVAMEWLPSRSRQADAQSLARRFNSDLPCSLRVSRVIQQVPSVRLQNCSCLTIWLRTVLVSLAIDHPNLGDEP